MKTRIRLEPEVRKHKLLDSAIQLAIKIGYTNITQKALADFSGVSTGLIFTYFGTIPNLKTTIMKTAVRKKIIPIIAQGVSVQDKIALNTTPALKQEAVKYLMEK